MRYKVSIHAEIDIEGIEIDCDPQDQEDLVDEAMREWLKKVGLMEKPMGLCVSHEEITNWEKA